MIMIQAGLTARATCWPASCTVSPSAAPTPTPSSPGGHLTIVLFSDWSLASQYSSLIGHLMTSVIFSNWSLANQYPSLIGHLITSVLFSNWSILISDWLTVSWVWRISTAGPWHPARARSSPRRWGGEVEGVPRSCDHVASCSGLRGML